MFLAGCHGILAAFYANYSVLHLPRLLKKNHFIYSVVLDCFLAASVYLRPITRGRFKATFISHSTFFPFDLQRSCTNLLYKVALIKVS